MDTNTTTSTKLPQRQFRKLADTSVKGVAQIRKNCCCPPTTIVSTNKFALQTGSYTHHHFDCSTLKNTTDRVKKMP